MLGTLIVIPAKAGIQINLEAHWIPAFAGMTGPAAQIALIGFYIFGF